MAVLSLDILPLFIISLFFCVFFCFFWLLNRMLKTDYLVWLLLLVKFLSHFFTLMPAYILLLWRVSNYSYKSFVMFYIYFPFLKEWDMHMPVNDFIPRFLFPPLSALVISRALSHVIYRLTVCVGRLTFSVGLLSTIFPRVKEWAWTCTLTPLYIYGCCCIFSFISYL